MKDLNNEIWDPTIKFNIILFLDCDMIIGPELLSKYAKFLNEKKKQIV